MAKTIRSKHLVILSLFILILNLHFQSILSVEDEENYDDEEHVLDSPLAGNQLLSTRSRFLVTASMKILKKGASCDAKTNPNVCNGESANKGSGLLYCCKKHCRDVLSDWNNCGVCGRKCQQWERCCGGVCTNVMTNTNNCGKCNRKCWGGIACDYGVCGYAWSMKAQIRTGRPYATSRISFLSFEFCLSYDIHSPHSIYRLCI